MAIDFEQWNEQFGGDDAVKALQAASENSSDFSELPDGSYVCRIEKLELGESKAHKPMIKGMFRITQGSHKKQCLFYNQVFCRNAEGNAFSIKKGLDFLRSLQIFDDAEVDFDGNYSTFNDLLLDMAEEAEAANMTFEIMKEKDGDYTRLTVTEVYE